MKLNLVSKNENQNRTWKWQVINEAGQVVGSVLSGNRPFAQYRLIGEAWPMTPTGAQRFNNLQSLMSHIKS